MVACAREDCRLTCLGVVGRLHSYETYDTCLKLLEMMVLPRDEDAERHQAETSALAVAEVTADDDAAAHRRRAAAHEALLQLVQLPTAMAAIFAELLRLVSSHADRR